jgi:hypothetical protein
VFAGYFGFVYEPTLDLKPCGYAIIKNGMIEVHTACIISIQAGTIPLIELFGTNNNYCLNITIPEGWNWQIIDI